MRLIYYLRVLQGRHRGASIQNRKTMNCFSMTKGIDNDFLRSVLLRITSRQTIMNSLLLSVHFDEQFIRTFG